MKTRKWKCDKCGTPCKLKYKDGDAEPTCCPFGCANQVEWKEVKCQ